MNLNLIIAAAIAVVLAVGYAALASHHHARGYAAHKAEMAAEITAVNEAREAVALADADARERERQAVADATADAYAAAREHCRTHPEACGIEVTPVVEMRSAPSPPSIVPPASAPPAPRCAAVCGTPAAVRAKLDAIN